MSTDVNVCAACGWQESGDELNPNRKKCPECGAAYEFREEVRYFTLSASKSEADR